MLKEHSHAGAPTPGLRGNRTAAHNILGRWLHFGIAVCVVLCVVFGWIAGRSGRPAFTLGATIAFNLHKFIGLNALLLLALFLTWSARGHARALGELFPWFSPARLRSIAQEWTREQAGMDLPATAAMVQGCGLAAAWCATTSGLALVLVSLMQDGAPAQEPSPARALAAIHSFADGVLWVYLMLHVGAVFLHAAKGNGERCARMFNLLQPDHDQRASS